MAVCNLFNKLTKTTGSFLVFSQYTDDITRFVTDHDAYTVEPSSFIAMDLDFSRLSPQISLSGSDLNTRVPEMLQKYLENGCAVEKEQEGWTPDKSTALFWWIMTRSGLLTAVSKDGDLCFDQVKYRGDINIQSYTRNAVDGMGYGELYCYIPNDTPALDYHFTAKYITVADGSSFEDSCPLIRYDGSFVRGWEMDKSKWTGSDLVPGNLNPPVSYCSCSDYISYNGSSRSTDESKSFSFNTIVVFYNVVKRGDDGLRTVLYKDIPYGIYFTGLIDEDGKMSNAVTKWRGNDDAFGQGTSYGLRICSKFVVQPSGALKLYNVNTDNENYSAFARAMSKMAESLDKMNDILDSVESYKKSITGNLALFTRGKVNVPYIMKVDGVDYWFVNGHSTGAVASTFGLLHSFDYDNETLSQNAMDAYVIRKELNDISSVINRPDVIFRASETGFPKGKGDVIVTFSWIIKRGERVMEGEHDIEEQYIYRRERGEEDWGEGVKVDNTARVYSVKLDGNTNTEFMMKVKFDSSNTIDRYQTIIFTSPSYLGYVSGDDVNAGNYIDWTAITSSLESNDKDKCLFQKGLPMTFEVSPNYTCTQIAYPLSLGEVSFIRDEQGNTYYDKSKDTNDFLFNKGDEYTYGGDKYGIFTIKSIAKASSLKLIFS